MVGRASYSNFVSWWQHYYSLSCCVAILNQTFTNDHYIVSLIVEGEKINVILTQFKTANIWYYLFKVSIWCWEEEEMAYSNTAAEVWTFKEICNLFGPLWTTLLHRRVKAKKVSKVKIDPSLNGHKFQLRSSGSNFLRGSRYL